MSQPHPPFFIEILEFKGVSAVSRGRLAEPSETLENAERRAELEVSTEDLRRSSAGFVFWTTRGERFSAGGATIAMLSLPTSALAARNFG
jgi:hypothetical protein